MSTTGFSTADFNLWPSFSKTVLLILMVTGACAGSTAGGLKISRLIILFKNALKEIRHVRSPKSVNIVRLNGEAISTETVRSAAGYFILYVLILISSVLLISVDAFSLETNLSAVLATLNNIGPGLGLVGPSGNYASFSYFSKIVLTLDMIFGRLEIIPMIVLLSPTTWRKKN